MVVVRPASGARRVLSRDSRLADTLRRVELDNACPRGDILPFIQFVDKRWTLHVECVPLEQVHTQYLPPSSLLGNQRLLNIFFRLRLTNLLAINILGSWRSCFHFSNYNFRRLAV